MTAGAPLSALEDTCVRVRRTRSRLETKRARNQPESKTRVRNRQRLSSSLPGLSRNRDTSLSLQHHDSIHNILGSFGPPLPSAEGTHRQPPVGPDALYC